MGRSLALHGSIPDPEVRPRFAIAAKGFRPFFALAAIHAVLVVPLWLAIVAGISPPAAYLDPATFHAHEMIFGYSAAVIAGFLLTAVGNWTGRETMIGAPLLGLAVLWAIGRGAMLAASWLPRGVPAIADLAFWPVLLVALGRPLVAAKNRRNFALLAMVGGLFAANVAVHLDALGVLAPGSARRATGVALDVVTLVIVVIAGRVFPMFTRNATRVATIRSHPFLDRATVAGMALVIAAGALSSEPRVANLLAGVVGVLAAARAIHWGAQHSGREPLLWILHAGYAWLVVGLLLRAAAVFVPEVPASLATHAVTVGAIGTLTLGMMARVSLGHTGRPIVAPPAMRGAFVAIVGAAAARVLLPLVAPSHYFGSLLLAGCLWSIAFAIFLATYLPILAAPRQDGKAG